MGRIRTLMAAATVAVAVIAAAGPIAAAEPGAAASCYGGGCTATWPSNTSCTADAGTVNQEGQWLPDSDPNSVWITGRPIYAPDLSGAQQYVGELQLRYSPSCGANWARVVYLQPGFHGELSAWNPGQPAQRSWIGADHSGNPFTPMVDGTMTACVGMQVYDQGIWREWDMGYCI